MIRKFLKAKSSTMFILLIAPLATAYIWIFAILFLSQQYGIGLSSLLLFIPAITLVVFFFLVAGGWLWSVAIGLHQRISEMLQVSLLKFKIIFFAIPFVCIISFLFLIFIDIPLQLIAYSGLLFTKIGILYLIYCCAQIMKTIELKRHIKFSDFAGECFLILFFPIGIWIIQPRINKIMDAAE